MQYIILVEVLDRLIGCERVNDQKTPNFLEKYNRFYFKNNYLCCHYLFFDLFISIFGYQFYSFYL